MNCKKCKNLIDLYIDGTLEKAEEYLLFEHIQDCDECACYYEDVYAIYNYLEDAERDVPIGFRTAWRTRVESAGVGRRPLNFKVLIPVVTACVCGVFVLSAVFSNVNLFTSGFENASIVYTGENAADTAAASPHDVAGSGGVQAANAPVEAVQGETAGGVQTGILEESSDFNTSDGVGTDVSIVGGEIDASSAPVAAPSAKSSASPGRMLRSVFAPQMEPYTIDATGKQIKVALVEKAKEYPQAVVTETMDGVLIKAETETLNKILSEFSLEQVVGQQTVKILCE